MAQATVGVSSRTIMSGFPGYPHDRPGQPPEQLPGWPPLPGWQMPGTSLVAAQQPQASSPRSKGLVGSGPSDVQLRRDNLGSSSGGGAQVLTPSYALLQQLQLQQLGGSSGPGSDTGGSVQHQSHQEEAQKPAKRGRGRQRKNTGVETAQQRAHRRFYERKKQRMAALEQEAQEKQEEYQQLLAINTELRRKHEALERAVAGRDEHMILIQALGSLSLDASRARQQPQAQQQPAHPHMPALQEEQKPGQPQQEQQQQAQHPGSQAHLHSRSAPSPTQAATGGSWAQLQDSLRCGSAPSAPAAGSSAAASQQQPEPPAELLPQVEEAGPFGLVQLAQFGSADADALPLVPNKPSTAGATQQTTGASADAQPEQQQPQQLMSWAADALDMPGPSLGRQGGQDSLWPAGGFMDLLESQNMSLTRSLSMPARTGGFDASLWPAGQQQGAGGMPVGDGEGAPQHASRSFSTTPTACMSRAGPLRSSAAAAAAAGDADWELGAFGGAAAREGAMLPPRPVLPPGSSRHHSWSGAAAGADSSAPGLLPTPSLSFGGARGPAAQGSNQPGTQSGAGSQASQLPPMAQLPGGLDFEAAVGAAAASGGVQQQQPQAWLAHLQQQQAQHDQRQQQQGAGPQDASEAGRQHGQQQVWSTITTAGPLVAPAPGQQLQQPQQQGLTDPPAFAGFQQPWMQQQQQQQQQQQPRRSALQQPEPQQVVQQLQQMGDMAFSSDFAAQLATSDMPDDILLFDTDMMDMLMERMSQQPSVEMLSPLPSIPSALLTGDSLRIAMADPTFAAALAGNNPLHGAHAAAAQHLQQQQDMPHQQQHALEQEPEPAVAGMAPPASHSSRQSSPGVTLLEASRQLQARHMAAGFYPARSANEMFYVHEMVDWYRTKLLQLQELLPYVDRPCPDVPCSLSLVQTMEEVIDGVRKFSTRNRIGVWELKLINLETGDCEEAPHSHWAMVAERIQLPAQMRESAMSCYRLYLEYVDKVKADRIAVLQEFSLFEQQLAAAAAPNVGSGIAPATLQFRADGYEAYQELIERLQLSLKREHMVANMLSYSLSQISSHVQMAKGMLSCWPYWPDGPSVLEHWLDAESFAVPQQGMRSQVGSMAGASGL